MTVPDNLKYSEEHQWVKIEGNTAIIGITDHAKEAVRRYYFCGTAGSGCEIAERRKLRSCRVGKGFLRLLHTDCRDVIPVNEKLLDSPEVINQDPYGEGWMLKLSSIEDVTNDLKDAQEYEQYLLANAQDDDS